MQSFSGSCVSNIIFHGIPWVKGVISYANNRGIVPGKPRFSTKSYLGAVLPISYACWLARSHGVSLLSLPLRSNPDVRVIGETCFAASEEQYWMKKKNRLPNASGKIPTEFGADSSCTNHEINQIHTSIRALLRIRETRSYGDQSFYGMK